MAGRTALAAAALAGAGVLALPLAASASTVGSPVTTGVSSFASAGYTGGASIAPVLTVSGSLSTIVPFVKSIVRDDLTPLVSALQGTANSAIGAAIGPASSLHVGTPTTQSGPAMTTFPGDLANLPSPCSTSSTSLPCLDAAGSTTTASPLAGLTLGRVRGWTQQVPTSIDPTTPVFGRSDTASASVSVLPAATGLTNPLVTTGAVDSIAACPNDGTTQPTASASAASVSALNGLVQLSVSGGAIGAVTVNGTTYSSLAALPQVTVGSVTVSADGDSVRIQQPVTLAQLLAGLGLAPSVVSDLTSYADSGTSLTLTVLLGPNTDLTTTSALAWGLGIGVDLSGTLSFTLAGVATATVTVPSGVTGPSSGNLLDLRLAYTSCSEGTTSQGASQAVPVTLV